MVRGVRARLLAAAGAMAVCATLTVGGAPAAAAAAPKPAAKPTSVQIQGKGIEETIVVSQSDRARLFESLLGEVSWMASAAPQTGAPRAANLGPKYVATVMVKTAPAQVYELYPLAAGGPRAHRPANQPAGKKADGWFYGRLTMSETLRFSGVPLEAKPDVVNGGLGGIGGGVGEDIADDAALDPVAQVNDMVSELRRVLLLNGVVLLVILAGLGGMAYVIRRRV
jgi:hypothetical protein